MKIFNGSWGAVEGGFSIGNKDGIYLAADGSVWEDDAAPLIGKRLSTSTGKVDYDWDEMGAMFQPSGTVGNKRDTVGSSVQKKHGCKIDSVAKLHLHWKQEDTLPREFTVQYRVLENGQPWTDDWRTIVCSTADPADNMAAFKGTSIVQVTALCDLDWSNCPLSSILQYKLVRTDDVPGDVLGVYLDVHVELDTIGSAEEYSKFVGGSEYQEILGAHI